MTPAPIDVELAGFDGTRLRGELHRPRGDAPFPAVVMTHGFSATAAMGLAPFARALCDAGIAVLVYDHRNLGRSDGEPRGEINPWAQMRDQRRALDWLAAREDVDAARLGVWGTSFSGGEALILAACDRRVRAVVANVPFAALAPSYPDADARFAATRDALLDESDDALSVRARVRTGPIAVVVEPGREMRAYLPQPESTEWFLASGARAGAGWRNEVDVVNAFGTDPSFDPGPCVEHVAPTPVLFVVASEDRLAATALALAAFERAREPKRLVVIEGHHFAPYAGEALEVASGAARDHFVAHL
ncbi:MAG: alpha/beta fold hydrolase [Myxococcota bacterium]